MSGSRPRRTATPTSRDDHDPAIAARAATSGHTFGARRWRRREAGCVLLPAELGEEFLHGRSAPGLRVCLTVRGIAVRVASAADGETLGASISAELLELSRVEAVTAVVRRTRIGSRRRCVQPHHHKGREAHDREPLACAHQCFHGSTRGLAARGCAQGTTADPSPHRVRPGSGERRRSHVSARSPLTDSDEAVEHGVGHLRAAADDPQRGLLVTVRRTLGRLGGDRHRP